MTHWNNGTDDTNGTGANNGDITDDTVTNTDTNGTTGNNNTP